jgi:hypothetical protein
MIKIGNDLCYSPFPPERYACGPLGLGAVVGRDIQLWNLVYLSCERIEDHLDPPDDTRAVELINRDLVVWYSCLAALTGAECKSLFPGLRAALTKHPAVMLQELRLMDWDCIPPAWEIKGWDEIVINKVSIILAQSRTVASLLTGRAASKI